MQRSKTCTTCLKGGYYKGRSRSRSFKRSIKGGWQIVRKSNPKLWAKVLAQVKREPGRWAAWKAIKADKMYKSKGGKFLS